MPTWPSSFTSWARNYYPSAEISSFSIWIVIVAWNYFAGYDSMRTVWTNEEPNLHVIFVWHQVICLTVCSWNLVPPSWDLLTWKCFGKLNDDFTIKVAHHQTLHNWSILSMNREVGWGLPQVLQVFLWLHFYDQCPWTKHPKPLLWSALPLVLWNSFNSFPWEFTTCV